MDYWKGKDYELPQNRILVLGESTYKSEDDKGEAREDPPLQIYVQQWIDRIVPRDFTFARICNACLGVPGSSATTAGRASFWNTIAFCNFVVEHMASSRTRPKKLQFESSKVAFEQVLDVLRPRAVWVLGCEMAGHAGEVLQRVGVPNVSVRHPASRGLRNAELTDSWNGLLGKIR